MPYNPEAIWERVSVLTDHVIESREHISLLQVEVIELRHCMGEIKRRQKLTGNTGFCAGLMAFLREVASPREWAIFIALLVALALGILKPAELKEYALGSHQTEQR